MAENENTNDIGGEYTDSSATKMTDRFGGDLNGGSEPNENVILERIEELGTLIERIRGKVDLNRFSDALRNLSSKLEA